MQSPACHHISGFLRFPVSMFDQYPGKFIRCPCIGRFHTVKCHIFIMVMNKIVGIFLFLISSYKRIFGFGNAERDPSMISPDTLFLSIPSRYAASSFRRFLVTATPIRYPFRSGMILFRHIPLERDIRNNSSKVTLPADGCHQSTVPHKTHTFHFPSHG